MRVCVQMYDERPMSASIPTRVTCTVAETPIQVKGASVTPQYVTLFSECRIACSHNWNW